MPWLDENQEMEKFRIILRKMAPLQSGDTGLFFVHLPIALKDMGVNPGQKLIDEWEMFSKIPWHPLTPGFISPFIHPADTNSKLIFYTHLIAHSMAAIFSLILIHITESMNETLQKHRIMTFMKGLSVMVNSAGAMHPAAEVDAIIIKRLLAGSAMLLTEAWNRFPDFFEPSALRINKSDIRNLFVGTPCNDENTLAMYSILADRYFPVIHTKPANAPDSCNEKAPKDITPSQNENENQQVDFNDVLGEITKTWEEISSMKRDLMGITKKKEILPQPEDQLIGSAEVCKRLHISKSTLKVHRDQKLYSYTKIGSRFLYSSIEINKILELGKNK